MLDAEIADLMRNLEGWSREGDAIVKTYRFANYHETMAFVNATAWISHRADHHPDLTVGYNQCTVFYTTHSAGGLSRKDFDCAAKIDMLFAL
jgi:4a-hydroxytetrahydrobiopterin dehydratase